MALGGLYVLYMIQKIVVGFVQVSISRSGLGKTLDMVLTIVPFCSESDHLHWASLPPSRTASRHSSSNSEKRPLVFVVRTGKDLSSHSEYTWEISPIHRRLNKVNCSPDGTQSSSILFVQTLPKLLLWRRTLLRCWQGSI